jgi:hypothetical protein
VPEPVVSAIRQMLAGRREALEDEPRRAMGSSAMSTAVELSARGLGENR